MPHTDPHVARSRLGLIRSNAVLSVLLAALVFGCGGASDDVAADPPEKPNVVYILSDTHRWGAMSFTQTPGVQTPNLQTLKEQGASFSRYYVNLPICTPYRALMMTGRWPYQQGLMANHMSLAERVDLPEGQKTKGTLSWAFKNAGYRTAHIGKWHLGGQDARPFGFDQSIIWMGTNNHRKTRYHVDGGPGRAVGRRVERHGDDPSSARMDRTRSPHAAAVLRCHLAQSPARALSRCP